MPLPGKLSIGILEEDNPQKSYFRLKPLLVQEGDRFAALDVESAYPEDGCLRIVPDKNESGHFKARMRRIGLYAVVDLRDHPGDHDKIRVNKNYSAGDGGERNACIIYSDVVREPAAGELFSLLPMRPEEADGALISETPGAARALLRPEGALLDEVWTFEPAPEQGGFRLVRDGARVDPSALQTFDIKGFQDRTLSFAVLPPSRIARPARPAEPQRPAEPARLTEPIRLPDGFRVEAADELAPQAGEPPRRTEARPEPAPRARAEKPPRAQEKPQPRDAKPSPRERAMAGQAGLNPRRGRSLQEIVDDKWRFSRLEQLGAPTPSLVTGEPVRSPAESALDAVRAAWDRRDQREPLVAALAKLDGLDGALNARRAAIRASAVNDQLNELEAQRLKMLDEIERLKRLGADVRESLKQEILRDQAGAFSDAVERAQRARAECARCEEEAARSRAVAESVQDAVDALTDGRFEARLREFAIHSRAAELLREAPRPTPPDAACVRPDAEALIARVLETFSEAGAPIDRAEAVNLLVCAAQSPVLLISGASGSGKTATARLLARALGVSETNFAEFPPDGAPLDGHPAVRLLASGHSLRATEACEALHVAVSASAPATNAAGALHAAVSNGAPATEAGETTRAATSENVSATNAAEAARAAMSENVSATGAAESLHAAVSEDAPATNAAEAARAATSENVSATSAAEALHATVSDGAPATNAAGAARAAMSENVSATGTLR